MSLPTQCPLCSAPASQQGVVTAHVYGDSSKSRAFFRCQDCDVCYQFPPLTAAEEVRFYAAEFEGFMAGRSGAEGGWQGAETHIRANEATRCRRMKYLDPLLQTEPRMRILEVGCSSGFMLLPLRSAHGCVGIEPSGVFSEYVRSQGIPVYGSMDAASDFEGDRPFDLIQHFFVLEHIGQPLEFLKQQVRLLKPGGRIAFEIPNSADPLHTIYDLPAFERFYWSIAHPWYFSERSLRYLLDRLGQPYEILLDQRYDLSNHMAWARDGRPGGMGRFTELLGTEIEESYKQGLIRRRICDTLIAVVTKH
jgi:SAM-dependent methyltransferase